MRSSPLRPERSSASAGSGPWSANLSRALRETLEAFASEAVTSEIILNALSDGGYETLPERADDLEDFASGALRSEITAVLGGEVADAVVDGLAPVLAMMRKTERDTAAPAAPPSSAPTLSPPPSPAPPARGPRPVSRPDLPAVSLATPARAPGEPPMLPHLRGKLVTPPSRPATPPPTKTANHERPVTGVGLLDLTVVTADDALISSIESRFVGRRVATGRALAALPRARVVVIDTRHAYEELSTTWPVAKAPNVVVLWPADARERALFEAMQPHVPRVVCAGDEAEVGDVLMLVALQLSPP